MQQVQIRPVDLHRQRTLESCECLVDGILGGLRVIENNSGKTGQTLVDRLDQFFLVVKLAIPSFIAVGFESDVKLAVEKTGRIGAIVRPTQF